MQLLFLKYFPVRWSQTSSARKSKSFSTPNGFLTLTLFWCSCIKHLTLSTLYFNWLSSVFFFKTFLTLSLPYPLSFKINDSPNLFVFPQYHALLLIKYLTSCVTCYIQFCMLHMDHTKALATISVFVGSISSRVFIFMCSLHNAWNMTVKLMLLNKWTINSTKNPTDIFTSCIY